MTATVDRLIRLIKKYAKQTNAYVNYEDNEAEQNHNMRIKIPYA